MPLERKPNKAKSVAFVIETENGVVRKQDDPGLTGLLRDAFERGVEHEQMQIKKLSDDNRSGVAFERAFLERIGEL